MSLPNSIQVVRKLLYEVRRATPSQKLEDSLIKSFILNECRKYKITDEQLCKKKNEVLFLADSYRCYLESTRRYKELIKKYQGKGERSVKETADMVGFKLPHDAK